MSRTARRAPVTARPIAIGVDEPAGTAPGDLPHILNIVELAAVLRRSVSYIESRLREGTFPIPMAPGLGSGTTKRPRLWRRSDVLDFLGEGKRPAYAGLRRR